MTDKSEGHLTSKNQRGVGTEDPLPPNPSQKLILYKQVCTRISQENKEKFEDILKEILENTDSEPFPDVSMREIKARSI